MKRRKVDVMAYAGYRSEERPHSFVIEGERIDIGEIISQWIGEDAEDRQQIHFFRVKGDDGFIYLLSYDVLTGEWHLE
jgi:hypothetical protein